MSENVERKNYFIFDVKYISMPIQLRKTHIGAEGFWKNIDEIFAKCKVTVSISRLKILLHDVDKL